MYTESTVWTVYTVGHTELNVQCVCCLNYMYSLYILWTICTVFVLLELYVQCMYCLNFMNTLCTVWIICKLNVLFELYVHCMYCLNNMYTESTHQISLVLKWKMKVCNPSSISENENISFFLFIDLHYFYEMFFKLEIFF